MYRFREETPTRLVVQHYPLMQRLLGYLLVLCALVLVGYFAYPSRVSFSCHRPENICTLEQTGLLWQRSRELPLDRVLRARLETVADFRGGSSYRIWVDTPQEAIPFTPYSSGGRQDKDRAVARINAFLKTPQAMELTAVQDYRWGFYLAGAGVGLLGALVLLFVRPVTCRIDRAGQQLVLKGGGLFGWGCVERSLSGLKEVFVEEVIKGGRPAFRVAFRLVGGEVLPFTYYHYPRAEAHRRMAARLEAFLL